MTSRERIDCALRHERPDRIPIDVGGTFATTLTAPACAALRAELGLPPLRLRIVEPGMLLVEMEADLRAALGVDTLGLFLGGGELHGWVPHTLPQGDTVSLSADLDVRARPDGGRELWKDGRLIALMPPGSLYFDAVSYPKWRDYDPAALTDAVLRGIESRIERAYSETDLAIVLNVPYTIFNGTSPDFLCALLDEKEESHARLAVWTDHILECLRLLLDAVRGKVSVMAFSGDAGMQNAPLIGPDLYREMILPHVRRIPEFLHRHSTARFFYHTCGAVFPLIDSFLDVGIDILNPLQVTASGMEAERLAGAFGRRLIFWGGGADAQYTLVRGTEAEVRRKVRDQLAHFGSHPGYVFAFDHNIQPDVPPRNVLAALDEARLYKRLAPH
jgi:uroporphyrinogen decarboxylase